MIYFALGIVVILKLFVSLELLIIKIGVGNHYGSLGNFMVDIESLFQARNPYRTHWLRIF